MGFVGVAALEWLRFSYIEDDITPVVARLTGRGRRDLFPVRILTPEVAEAGLPVPPASLVIEALIALGDREELSPPNFG